jgi:hypothetical protein
VLHSALQQKGPTAIHGHGQPRQWASGALPLEEEVLLCTEGAGFL